MPTTTRPVGKNHIPHVPAALLILRVLQLVLAIVLLGLAAYGISVYSTSGFDLTLFTAIVTIIFIVYALLTEKRLAIGYNYWAILALDLFLIIFWLVSFAKTAAEASNLDRLSYYVKGTFYGLSRTYRNVLIVCAVFGAFQFLLFIITLFATAVFVHKHRQDGGHSQPHTTMVAPGLEMDRQMDPQSGNRSPTESTRRALASLANPSVV